MAVIARGVWNERGEIAATGLAARAERLSPPLFALASAVVARTSVIEKRKSKESRRLTPDEILSLRPAGFLASASDCRYSSAGGNGEDVGQMDETERESVRAEPFRLDLDLG